MQAAPFFYVYANAHHGKLKFHDQRIWPNPLFAKWTFRISYVVFEEYALLIRGFW
jgi:hypothetical protein